MTSPKKEDDKPQTGGLFGSSTGLFGATPGAGGLFGAASTPGAAGGLFGNAAPFSFGSEASAAFGAVSSPSKPPKASNNGDGNEEDEDGGGEGSDNDADESHAAEFKPVVQLSLVEVRSCEEDEDVAFKRHSKLFIFIKEDNYGGEVRRNYWKERGLGDIKILQHRLTGDSRLLMRQEKTLKIAANHRIDPQCELKRTSDKAVSFSAVDFANDEAEAKKEVFSLKFGQVEDADQFVHAFAEAKLRNAKVDREGGGGAAAPVAAPVVAAVAAPVAAPAAPPAPVVSVGAFSKTEDVFSAEVRQLGQFAATKLGKGRLVRIASAKSQVVAGKNYRLALHILYGDSEGEVHAHVVTVFQPLPHEAAGGPQLSDHVHTGRIY